MEQKKPTRKPATRGPAGKRQPPAKPGDGLLGWLGRQVGYVSKAVKTKPGVKPSPAPKKAAPPAPPQVIYRENRVEEAEHPDQPGVKLRRTIIDEVVVDKPTTPPRDGSRSSKP